MDLRLSPKEIARYNRRRPKAARGSVCHAPSRSLYFGMRGEVMLCCANRSHLAGRYPEQSIRECWTSANAVQLRKSLEDGDLSLGCKGCYDIIRGGNYLSMPGRIYDTLRANPRAYPSRMDFELTNTCNLECVMCRGELSSAIRRNRDGLPPIPSPYGEAFLTELEEFIPHLSQSYFAGGEPFMIKEYLEIWDRMAILNPNHQLSVQTNATLLTDRVKKLLEALRISIAVSIDSVHKERLEQIRRNADFDKVMEHIDYFLDYSRRKGTQLTISYTPMSLNWMELPDAIEFCNRLGIKIFFNTLSYPRHYAFGNQSGEKLREIADFLGGYRPPKGNEVRRANRQAFLDLLAQIRYWRDTVTAREQKAASQAKGPEAYFQSLENYIQDHYASEKASPLFSEIRAKIEAVIASEEARDHTEAIWEHLGTIEPAMLCAFIPGKSIEELRAALKTAVINGL